MKLARYLHSEAFSSVLMIGVKSDGNLGVFMADLSVHRRGIAVAFPPAHLSPLVVHQAHVVTRAVAAMP